MSLTLAATSLCIFAHAADDQNVANSLAPPISTELSAALTRDQMLGRRGALEYLADKAGAREFCRYWMASVALAADRSTLEALSDRIVRNARKQLALNPVRRTEVVFLDKAKIRRCVEYNLPPGCSYDRHTNTLAANPKATLWIVIEDSEQDESTNSRIRSASLANSEWVSADAHRTEEASSLYSLLAEVIVGRVTLGGDLLATGEPSMESYDATLAWIGCRMLFGDFYTNRGYAEWRASAKRSAISALNSVGGSQRLDQAVQQWLSERDRLFAHGRHAKLSFNDPD